MTIYNNIRFGKPDATADEIYAAAKSANAHKFISNLPRGYEAQPNAALITSCAIMCTLCTSNFVTTCSAPTICVGTKRRWVNAAWQ